MVVDVGKDFRVLVTLNFQEKQQKIHLISYSKIIRLYFLLNFDFLFFFFTYKSKEMNRGQRLGGSMLDDHQSLMMMMMMMILLASA